MSQYGNYWFASSGPSYGDPSRVSQSDFEGFTSNGTHSTWNYAGYSATGGNTLTLASPGSNVFREHNTTKTDGFLGHTFVQWSFSGYAWGLASMFSTSTAAEASEAYLETVTSTYYIFRKHPADHTYFNFYSTGGGNSTSGNAVVGSAWGTGSSYNESGPNLTIGVNGTASQFRYHGDSNPFFIRAGRDENDYLYVQGFYGGGNSAPDLAGTGFTVTDKYYLNKSGTPQWQTNTTGAAQLSDGIQFGWGNYDGGTVELHKHVEFWTAGP